MPIPESFRDDLIGRTDIVGLVSEYVRMTKRSGSNMFGLCPFHSEKTPSFSINAEKQIYYCFGCGKGGGVINFIMEIENVPYRDAIEILAKRAGMTVPESGVRDELAGRRARILELNRDAARHFHEVLKSPAGGPAREYLVKRGITRATVTRFGLGAVPDSWNSLLDAMKAKGYAYSELIEAGLAKAGKSAGSAYDFFRSRLMFPVIDVKGDVIGFSGRSLGDAEPKYLNSPDTYVFSKSRNLFALNLAKKSKTGMLILAEGNIDVVMLHQMGFDCAVASLGTSLTADQSRLMSRYVSKENGKVVVAFDSDGAGRKATLRAIPLLEMTGMSIKILNMGDSKDPDEFLRKHGPDAFRALLEHSENHIEYRLMTLQGNANMATDEGKLSYLSSATDLLAELESKPEREIYGARVARTAGVSSAAVLNEVNRKFAARKSRQKKDFERKAARPAAALQPASRELRYKNECSAAAEEGIIRCLVRDPTVLHTAEEAGLSRDDFTSEFLSKVYDTLAQRISEGRDVKEAQILSELESNEAALLTSILQKPEVLPNSEKTIREYLSKVRAEKYKTETPDEDLLREIMKYKQNNSDT